jgi:hypothetical protein
MGNLDIVLQLKAVEKDCSPAVIAIIHEAWQEIQRLRESNKVYARAVEIAESKIKEA